MTDGIFPLHASSPVEMRPPLTLGRTLNLTMLKLLKHSKQLPAGKDIIRLLSCCAIIAGMTFIAFSPSLKNGFTNWDDDAYVVKNPDIKAFGLRHAAKVFSSIYIKNYQPITMLTYMAEFHFFK
ncbi:MAG: hypothetical protein ABSF80_12845, partial [Chitinispirillaceae bacterium]